MAEMKVKKPKTSVPASAPGAPDITFTEDDVKAIEDFINFVYLKLSGVLTVKEMFAFHKLYIGASQHAKKCRDRIFELHSTSERPKQ